MNIPWKQLLVENFSYKLVALFISLILWFTILGRRDFSVTKNIELDLVPPIGYVLQGPSSDHIKVKVSGPRTALRRFLESGSSPVLSIDLQGYEEGTFRVPIPLNRLDLPFGVKVISVRPTEVEVKLTK